MAEFEQVKPMEDIGAPAQLRHELRQQFKRWLPCAWQPRPSAVPDEEIDALSLLELSQYYRLEHVGGAADLAVTWDASTQRMEDGGPDFAELKRLRWVIFDGARWVMERAPRGASKYVEFPSPSTETFLLELERMRLVAKGPAVPVHVQALGDRLKVKDLNQRPIPVKDPQWLSGRLWELLCPRPTDPLGADDGVDPGVATNLPQELGDEHHGAEVDADAVDRAFLEWSAWCLALNIGSHSDEAWDEVQKRCCRQAAQRVLARQERWGTWEGEFARYA